MQFEEDYDSDNFVFKLNEMTPDIQGKTPELISVWVNELNKQLEERHANDGSWFRLDSNIFNFNENENDPEEHKKDLKDEKEGAQKILIGNFDLKNV